MDLLKTPFVIPDPCSELDVLRNAECVSADVDDDEWAPRATQR